MPVFGLVSRNGTGGDDQKVYKDRKNAYPNPNTNPNPLRGRPNAAYIAFGTPAFLHSGGSPYNYTYFIVLRLNTRMTTEPCGKL